MMYPILNAPSFLAYCWTLHAEEQSDGHIFGGKNDRSNISIKVNVFEEELVVSIQDVLFLPIFTR